MERKQQKEEKKLKAAEEKSRAKGNSPAPIRIKISLKGKNGKNGSGANSRAQSDNESVDSEGPSLASKAESEISDPASDAEVCHNMHRLLIKSYSVIKPDFSYLVHVIKSYTPEPHIMPNMCPISTLTPTFFSTEDARWRDM